MNAQQRAAVILLVHPALLPTDTPGRSRCSGCARPVTWRVGGVAPNLTDRARAQHALADHQVAALNAAGLLHADDPTGGAG